MASWLQPGAALASPSPQKRRGAAGSCRRAGCHPGKAPPKHGAGPGGVSPFPVIHPSHWATTSPCGLSHIQRPFVPSIAAHASTSAPRSAGDGLTPPALLGVRIPLGIGYRSLGGDVIPGHEAVSRKNSRTNSQRFDSQSHI